MSEQSPSDLHVVGAGEALGVGAGAGVGGGAVDFVLHATRKISATRFM